ncbi:TonB-dependent receptor [Helicobacter anatolicus]|uniref:TonB-dependent receptor n=1 Tax=Helicobacter anatolicus TaxID=2905874 RepID=UPI001E4E908A|nr:TonB-dependent receptor [Helicobacter anatolicus]MCE3039863.1 TonB-dependent receptor [Helicobacter anatolicus]
MKKYFLLCLVYCSSIFAEEQNVSEIKKLDKIITHGFESKLDELNRNVYLIDKEMIENKGYKNTEDIFAYTPFVGISNTGLGGNIDLRGQGNSANINTQILLNGISLNMLDSSHGVTPINSINPSDIESIEILPGGGAVMYGNGTRGGVVNIITKKRYKKFSPNLGINYSGVPQSPDVFGSQISTDARFGGEIVSNLYYTLSGRYFYKKGYRQGDESNTFNIGASITYDINPNHSLSFEASYFKGFINTTPPLLMSIDGASPNLNNNLPSKDKRYNAGEGIIHLIQDRLDATLSYDYQYQNLSIQSKLFYHYYKNYYAKNIQDIWFNASGRGVSYVKDVSQNGSYFIDQKLGFQTKLNYNHKNGLFIIGIDSIFNQGDRKLNLNYIVSQPSIFNLDHTIITQVIPYKFSNSLFAIEKYNFSKSFSLTAGARYEIAKYGGNRKSDRSGYTTTTIPNMNATTKPFCKPEEGCPWTYNINEITNNFALELTPKYSFDFKNVLGGGDLYAKYEKGFLSPNPDKLTQRDTSNNYSASNVKSETYHTLELGTKLNITEHLFLSGAIFYTLTQNEIYTNGTVHAVGGISVGNYDLTQRTGIELYSEQSFFNNALSFNQSFTYIDARILKAPKNATYQKGDLIPYVSNYKVTLGLSYAILENLKLWTQNSFIGTQKDFAQKNIKAYSLTDIGIDYKIKHFSITAGIRNLFDTLYFSYYNSSTTDYTTGFNYQYAQGRSIFLEGRYAF